MSDPILKPDDMRDRRTCLGLSWLRLARLAGVDQRTVARAERGQNTNPASLMAIKHALEEAEVKAGIRKPPEPKKDGAEMNYDPETGDWK